MFLTFLSKKTIYSIQKACKPLIITGPSGAGKTTFMKQLLKMFPDKFEKDKTHTTRLPR